MGGIKVPSKKQFVQVRNERTGKWVGTKVIKADTFWLRLKGLLGKSGLEEGEGLWLFPCHQVHMLGMRFPLSVWFLDQKGFVCAIADELEPMRISPNVKGASSAIEFPAGWAELSGTIVGDKLIMEQGL